MAHKNRELLIKQRTMSENALRGHLAEFGVIAAKGIGHVEELIERAAAADLPAMVQATLGVLLAQLRLSTRRSTSWSARSSPARSSTRSGQPAGGERPRRRRARRFGEFRRVTSDPQAFKSGRDFAAWLGVTPKQNSTGGKEKLGVDNQAGQSVYPTASGYTRPRSRSASGAKAQGRVVRLAGRAQSAQTGQVVAVALANKLARIVWAIITTGEVFRTSIYAKA